MDGETASTAAFITQQPLPQEEVKRRGAEHVGDGFSCPCMGADCGDCCANCCVSTGETSTEATNGCCMGTFACNECGCCEERNACCNDGCCTGCCDGCGLGCAEGCGGYEGGCGDCGGVDCGGIDCGS